MHRHDAAGFAPENFFLIAVEVVKSALIDLFSRNEKMIVAVIVKFCHGIAFFQLADYFFVDIHEISTSLK